MRIQFSSVQIQIQIQFLPDGSLFVLIIDYYK